MSGNSGETAQFGQALEVSERSSLVDLETKWRWVILLLYLLFSLVGIFLARVLELNPRLFCMIDAKKQSSAAAVAAGTLSQSVAELPRKRASG